MARSVLVDTGLLVAFLSARDGQHSWSVAAAERYPPPWTTCDAVLSEAFHLLGPRGEPPLAALLRRRALIAAFDLDEELERVLKLMEKYSNVPMSLADACLVRLSETAPDPVLLTTDADFRIYRRLGRQSVPVLMPPTQS
jgi:predicted nucleic acid-binding protein